jgi:putative tryptophan/tyrosine transport system substrate-binding protein
MSSRMSPRSTLEIARGNGGLALSSRVPMPAASSRPARIWRIGYLSPGALSDVGPASFLQAFRRRLGELGYREGRNVIIDMRSADGDFARLPRLAAELASLAPDVMVAASTSAVLAARRMTTSIPIVIASAADPVANGLVKSLARPGGNITGLSNMAPGLTARTVAILRSVVPAASRIAVLMSANPSHLGVLEEARTAARTFGAKVVAITAAVPADLDEAFATMAKQRCDALLVPADARLDLEIVDLAAEARLPAIYQLRELVQGGGLVSYGPSYVELFRRAAAYVDRIFKGASPAELPVEQPTQFELVINLETAKALGLDVPATLLAAASEVIE